MDVVQLGLPVSLSAPQNCRYQIVQQNFLVQPDSLIAGFRVLARPVLAVCLLKLSTDRPPGQRAGSSAYEYYQWHRRHLPPSILR